MIGVVVIGRNEGARLERCLRSIVGSGAPVVYVDSGSTDNSRERAAALGAEVVRLDPTPGFTAGRARNLGFETLVSRRRRPDVVQFVDGDCVMDSGWLEAARGRLEAAPQLAVVTGHLRELHPEASIFNRLCDMEWNAPAGPSRWVGGIAMFRTEAFAAAGGFDPDLICGEEPELCLRLLRAGWAIERLADEMALHDAAMTRWRQWARRSIRGGWAFEEGAVLHGEGPEGYNRAESRSVWLWGALVPLAALICAVLAAAAAGAGSALWPIPTAAALTGLLAYPAMAARIALRRRRTGDPWRLAALYGAMTMLGKIPQALGAARFRLARMRGRRGRIIEYKTATRPAADRA